MRVLLDSGAYSQLMQGREQVSRIVRGAEEVLLSAVVLGELLMVSVAVRATSATLGRCARRRLDRGSHHGDGGRSGVGRPPLRTCGRNRLGSADGRAQVDLANGVNHPPEGTASRSSRSTPSSRRRLREPQPQRRRLRPRGGGGGGECSTRGSGPGFLDTRGDHLDLRRDRGDEPCPERISLRPSRLPEFAVRRAP